MNNLNNNKNKIKNSFEFQWEWYHTCKWDVNWFLMNFYFFCAIHDLEYIN